MGGVFSRSTRAASVSLVPAPSSPTHSGSGGSSRPLSSDGSPKSPRSPVTLALPSSHSPEKYPGIHADQASLLSPDDLFSLEKLEDGDAEVNPVANLSTCGLVRANVARRYEQFAMSKVGLVTRAFLMSLPQSLTVANALMFAASGLATPSVELKGSDDQVKDYFFIIGLLSTILAASSAAYDTYSRLSAHFQNQTYSSFGIFRLRASFMGAALGGLLMRDILYNRVDSKDLTLNFSLGLPATLVPAFLRYFYFKHDVVPLPLNGERSLSTMEVRGAEVSFKARALSVLTTSFTSGAAGLIFYRAFNGGVLHNDIVEFTPPKILLGLIPAFFGGVIASMDNSDSVKYRWKQAEILIADSSMIFLGIGSCFFGFNKMEMPEYWWNGLSYAVFSFGLLCAVAQASRLIRKNLSNCDESSNTRAALGR